MALQQRIQLLAQQHHEDIRRLRRHIHAHPELSFEEHETARFVSQELQAMGLQPIEGVAGTGVTVLIEGRNPTQKTIALRADMDALPIEEANDVPYRSQHPGIMHACGHDVHTASLLGAARILQAVKADFEGTIKLIFQPGEERAPGGASQMIEAGVLENPNPQAIIGQHVMPYLPVGTVGFRSGEYMASADEIYLQLTGKGGHAAMPERFNDPVTVAAQIIVALQQIISRKNNPRNPAVLSFGHFQTQGKAATNIIPDSVSIAGTLRTLDPVFRMEAHGHIARVVQGIASAFEVKADLEIRTGYPPLKNDPDVTARAKAAATRYMGPDRVVDLDIWLAAEDFAFFAQERPACFYRLGTRNESRGIVSGVHTPTFDIDEDALPIGAGLMAWLAIEELGWN
ncbi:MAG: M20 family metallopeptidase [Bernardetiaceae bacterium]